MPRQTRSREAKRKDNNHRAALHHQKKAHDQQLFELLSVVEETQGVISRLIDSCAASTSRQADNTSNTPAPSPSSQPGAQEDLRARLDQRTTPSPASDLRHQLNDHRQPTIPGPRRHVRERSRSPLRDRTGPRRHVRERSRSPPRDRTDRKRTRRD